MAMPIPKPGETFCGEDGTISTILPDFCDPNYEPPQDELEEYATCIGIDPATEPELMWIALEGLRAPLPSGWRACETGVDDGEGGDEEKKEVYYFNFETGDSLWDHPMDEVFRDRVKQERAKLKKNSGSSGPGGLHAGPGAGYSEARTVPTGATKSIANALFGGNKSGIGNGDGGRLGSLPLMDSGVGGGRGFTDVSDVLGSANASGIGSSSLLGGLRPFGPSSVTPGSPGVGSSPRGPMTMKDMEANLRKRIEDEYAPKEREEELRRDREIIEERSKLERELTAFRAQLDRAWEADNNKTEDERLAEIDAEAKTIEDGWTQRLADERTRVKEIEDKIRAKHAEIRALKASSIDVLRKQLIEKNEAEVKTRRDTLKKGIDDDLAKKEREREEILDEMRRKGDQTVATARSRLEADHKKQQEVKATFNAKLRAGAEAEVQRLEKELAEAEARLREAEQNNTTPSGSAAASTGPGTAAAAEAEVSVDALTAAIVAVEAEAHSAETQHKDRMAKLNVEYTVKCDTVRSQLKRKEKEALEQSHTSHTTSVNTPLSTTSLSREQSPSAGNSNVDTQKLENVEATLKRELDEAKSKYEQETEALVAKAKAKAAADAARSAKKSQDASGVAENANVSSTSGSPTTSTAPRSPQEQRAKDAENTRHILSLKQLETKHEQMVRQIRERHHKALTSTKRLDPRTAANYAKEMTTRKRAWLTEHPAPQAELPELPPIPKMVSLMGDMPAVEPPSEEEQNAYLQERLIAMRELWTEEEEEAKRALTERKRRELDAFAERYRTEQLELTKKRVAAYEDELRAKLKAAAPTAAATVKSTAAGASPVAAISPAELASLKALEEELGRLKESLSAARAEAAAAKTAFEAERAALRTRIATAERQRDAAKSTPSAATVKLATSNPDTPRGSTAKEPIVVFEQDFANYISNEEAAAAETALKDRYQAELARLKAAAAQEMERYEAALKQLAEAREKHPQQLPPPAPTSAATPLNRSAMGTEEPVGTGAAHPLSATPVLAGVFTPTLVGQTPIMTRARSMGSGGLSSGGGGAPLFGSRTSQPGNGSLNASSIHPGSVAPFLSPHNQRVPEFLTDDVDGDADGAGLPGRVSGVIESSPVPHTEEHVAYPRDEVYEERLRTVQLALRARRGTLRARQTRLEGLREEWRRDMAACRAAKDRSQARVLKKAKQALEEQARGLNEAVTETKDAGQQLKQERQRYEAYLVGGPAAVERRDVLMMIEEVANKTAALEHVLLDHPRDHPTSRSRVRAGSARTHARDADRPSDSLFNRDLSRGSGGGRSASASAGPTRTHRSDKASPPLQQQHRQPRHDDEWL